MENNAKTAYDLLINGFNWKPPIFQTLKLGETRIPLETSEQNTLTEAINAKDYYEIKNILSKLHNIHRDL